MKLMKVNLGMSKTSAKQVRRLIFVTSFSIGLKRIIFCWGGGGGCMLFLPHFPSKESHWFSSVCALLHLKFPLIDFCRPLHTLVLWFIFIANLYSPALLMVHSVIIRHKSNRELYYSFDAILCRVWYPGPQPQI